MTGGTVLATDSILTAFGKLQNQVNGIAGGVTYQGVWDASANSPSLTSSVGTKGYYYVVSVAGSTNLNGITDWKLGDWVIFNGNTWEKVDNTDAVVSVNGFTGAVSLTTTNITEGTNLYYTDTRARAAISLTTTGSSGAATYSGGVLNVPQYTLAGLGGVPSNRTLTINGTAYDLSADRTWTISAGVSSVSGSGAGISVSPTTGAVVVSNTGVTSIVAGTAISISGSTGAVTINNAGVTSVNGNTGAITGIITTSNYNSYSPTLTGGGASGTWGIRVTGFANAGTPRLYASDAAYNYDSANPYYMYMTYDGSRWFLQVSPATPSAVRVAYADAAGNADTVDGYHASTSTIGNYIVVRDGNGYIFGNYINMTDDGNPGGGTSISSFITKQGDNYYRSVSPTNAMASIRGVASGTWGISVSGTAAGETLATVTGRGASTSTDLTFTGFLTMGTGGTSYIRMGRFPASVTNTGEAWIGRASDRNSGTMTVQLGGNSASSRQFEVVDYAWSTVLFNVSSGGDATASSSMRAPIFYDSQNTGYYVDPASNSNIYQLTVNGDHQGGYGIVRVSSSNDALVSLYTGNNSTAGLRLQNSSSLDLIFVGKKSGSTDFVVDFGFAGSSEEFIVDSNGNTFSRTSSRAPIFYDSDDTGYYADFNSTGTSIRTRGEIYIGANSAGRYLRIGGNGGGTDEATVSASNGNLHIDCKAGYGLYLNYYSTNTIYLGSGYTITSNGGYYNGTAAAASTASQVTVNSGNSSASWYPIVWHSGNTLYSSSGLAEIYPQGGYARFNYINTSDNDETGITRFVIKNGDNYHRSATTTTAMTVIRGVASGTWGISVTGNAATVDGRSVGTSTNNIPFLGGTRNLVINNPENYSGEVRLGAAWDRGGVYTSNILSLGTSAGEIHFVFSNATKAYFNSTGNLYVGQGTAYSSIYMGDSDEGQREIHCNSNRIGFLNQSSSWGSYCDDTGNWVSDFSITAASDLRGNDVYTTGGWFRNHTNNNGIYWSNTGWHLYPSNSSDFYMRSGANSASIRFLRSDGTTMSYLHTDSGYAIGFLTDSGSWRFNVNNSGAMQAFGPIRRSAHLAGWLEGTYNNIGPNDAKSNPIYTIGSSYNPAEGSLSNMYGIGYSHPNFWGSGKVGGWGLYVASAGVIDAIIGGDGAATSIWARTDIVAYSDARVKENVEVVQNALEKIQAIRGVTFTRNDVKDTKKRSAGVIAQEVLKIFPEVVTGSEEDMYSVAYGNMAALFIEAIKEQQKQIEELKLLISGTSK